MWSIIIQNLAMYLLSLGETIMVIEMLFLNSDSQYVLVNKAGVGILDPSVNIRT